MPLKSYLESRNLTIVEFAGIIEVSRHTITNYIYGKRDPTAQICRRIILATKGKISLDELLDQDDWVLKFKEKK